jgi:hypothetical protein
MAAFSNGVANFTPSLSADNFTLDASVTPLGLVGKVTAFSWGGSGTTSIGYRTRWVRPTTKGITSTAIVVGTPDLATPGMAFVSSYSTPPVLPTENVGNLHYQNWNVQGGNGYIILADDSQWTIINGILQGSVSCRNLAGVDNGLSNYFINWQEGN